MFGESWQYWRRLTFIVVVGILSTIGAIVVFPPLTIITVFGTAWYIGEGEWLNKEE
jgi:hypothetical protein